MSIPINLEGRVILVCGVGKGGIGGPTARIISAAGATVVAVDKTQQLLDPTIADIKAAGGRCHGIVADLMDPAQTDPIVATAVERFGRLDGVANVAGGTRADEWMRLEETPLSSFHASLNLNFEYTFRICRDAARYMIKNNIRGSLVNVGSISSLNSAPYHGPYGAAKAAMSALTRTMAIEWQPYGIRTNTVHPGAVPTERTKSFGSDPSKNAGMPQVVRTAPEAVGHAIAFFLSDLASGITGQNLVVDSGLSANYCSGAINVDSLPKKS
ncbi:MAG: SDR family oxidoreductase [Rhodospirillaceae bacterium]|nr:MAG: SDR family oxidoreductase [Rhodospirillaceae bacterium]